MIEGAVKTKVSQFRYVCIGVSFGCNPLGRQQDSIG
jgi:hypothetical protein